MTNLPTDTDTIMPTDTVKPNLVRTRRSAKSACARAQLLKDVLLLAAKRCASLAYNPAASLHVILSVCRLCATLTLSPRTSKCVCVCVCVRARACGARVLLSSCLLPRAAANQPYILY